MRGPGSIGTGGNILSLDFFCFHVVNPLKPILALLPMLCVCEKSDWKISLMNNVTKTVTQT